MQQNRPNADDSEGHWEVILLKLSELILQTRQENAKALTAARERVLNMTSIEHAVWANEEETLRAFFSLSLAELARMTYAAMADVDTLLKRAREGIEALQANNDALAAQHEEDTALMGGAAEIATKLKADWDTLIHLQRAVMRNPHDSAAKQERELFLREAVKMKDESQKPRLQ